MTTVAECAFCAVLTAAEINGLILSGRVGRRSKAATPMRPITKRLAFAKSTSAPVIGFSTRYRDWKRAFLGAGRFIHRGQSFTVVSGNS